MPILVYQWSNHVALILLTPAYVVDVVLEIGLLWFVHILRLSLSSLRHLQFLFVETVS